ncbi:MAG: hypothetical protein WAL20_09400, partial [Rhodomicrobium sp.]
GVVAGELLLFLCLIHHRRALVKPNACVSEDGPTRRTRGRKYDLWVIGLHRAKYNLFRALA